MRILLLATVVALATAVPARAADTGVLTGRVMNESSGTPAAGALVRLSGANEDGSERVNKKVKVGPDGRYRFDGLPAGQDWLYVIDATFDGGLFPGSPFGFPQGETPKLESSLKVWDTTTDPNSILVTRDAMFVLPSENSVRVVESVEVLNHTHLAYIGRGQMGQSQTTFGFGLPAGAGEVQVQDASLDVPQLVETDFGFGITVALPPGDSNFTYSYRVPADALTYVLSKTALYPTADLLVFVGEPLQLESNRLQESPETVTVDGKEYRRWTAPGTVDAGDTVLLQATAQAEMQWLPFAIGGAVFLLLISGGYMFMRKRQRDDEAAPEESRDDLIAAIASLDIAFESGSLEEKDWETARTRLKSRLIELERA